MQTVSVSHRFHVKVPRLFFLPVLPFPGFAQVADLPSSTIHSAEDTLDFNMKHVMLFQIKLEQWNTKRV